MEKKQAAVGEIIRLCQIVLGNAMYAAAVVLFIVPNGLITGGTTGLVLFAFHTMGIPTGLFVGIFNTTMFLFGAWILGKQSALAAALGTVIYPLTLGLLKGLGSGGFVMQEKLTVVIYTGIFIGVGIGIIMRAGASTEGMDISPLALKKKFEISTSFSLHLMDCIILSLRLISADPHTILYGILLIIVYTMVLNKIPMSGNTRIQVKIVSRKYETTNRLITERLDCGASLLHMRTEYLHREQKMILAVIVRRDLPGLSQLVMDKDPGAFMIINQINEVKGREFTLKRMYQDSAYQEQIYQEQEEGSV